MTLATVIFTEKWHLTCAVLQTLTAGDLNVCAVTQQSKKMFSSAQVSEVHLLACSNSRDNYPKDKKNSYFNNDLVAVLPINIFYCHSIYTCALHNQCTAWYELRQKKNCRPLLPRYAVGNPKMLWKKNIQREFLPKHPLPKTLQFIFIKAYLWLMN